MLREAGARLFKKRAEWAIQKRIGAAFLRVVKKTNVEMGGLITPGVNFMSTLSV